MCHLADGGRNPDHSCPSLIPSFQHVRDNRRLGRASCACNAGCGFSCHRGFGTRQRVYFQAEGPQPQRRYKTSGTRVTLVQNIIYVAAILLFSSGAVKPEIQLSLLPLSSLKGHSQSHDPPARSNYGSFLALIIC